MNAPSGPRSESRTLALFVTGAAISNAGSYMQLTAVPFVLFELTDSNAWVGAAAFAGLFLSVVIGPVAGIAIDRYSQKSVLMAGRSCSSSPRSGCGPSPSRISCRRGR